MCYGYKGYSDLWWEDAEERRRLEVDRRRQEAERLARQEHEFERERREVLRARQDEQLRRLEREMIETGTDAERPAKVR
ncbi:MAG TPA: hypothetical protein VL117_03550 [Thermoleophilia bacterium]|nr:hypothetical protein [Thermoleophilia bacterium]